MKKPYFTADLVLPGMVINSVAGLPAVGNRVIDAGTEYLGHVYIVPPQLNGSTLKTIEFYVNTVGSAGNITASVETVTALYPTGSAYGGSASGAAAVSATGWTSIDLTTAATLTAGELFCPKIVSAGNHTIRHLTASYTTRGYGSRHWDYAVYNTGADTTILEADPFAYKDSDGNYLDFGGLHGWHTYGAQLIETDGTAIGGARWRQPFTGFLESVAAAIDFDNTNDVLRLASSGQTLLSRTVADLALARPVVTSYYPHRFPVGIWLEAGNVYDLVVEAAGATATDFAYFQYANAALKNLVNGSDLMFQVVGGASLGALAEVDASYAPAVGLRFSKIASPNPLIGRI